MFKPILNLPPRNERRQVNMRETSQNNRREFTVGVMKVSEWVEGSGGTGIWFDKIGKCNFQGDIPFTKAFECCARPRKRIEVTFVHSLADATVWLDFGLRDQG